MNTGLSSSASDNKIVQRKSLKIKLILEHLSYTLVTGMLRVFASRRELSYARDFECNDGLIVVLVIFSYAGTLTA